MCWTNSLRSRGAWRCARILTIVSAVLLGKDLLAAVVNFFRRYYGERMRILVSRDLSLKVVSHMLTFRIAFFTTSGNEAGRLQSRIDKGVMVAAPSSTGNSR